jgi:hypothetical protein
MSTIGLAQVASSGQVVDFQSSSQKEISIMSPEFPGILAGLQTVLDLLAEENPKAKSAKPEDFVDNRFIKELDDSGYIDSLYKSSPRP